MPDVIQKRRDFRKLLIYSITGAFLIIMALSLIWGLRDLILPSIVGALAAYLCRPLLRIMKRKGLSHSLAILVLFCIFVGSITLLTKQIQSIIPDDEGKLVLRVRTQYKLNVKYREFMGLNKDPRKGNFFYQMLGNEIQPTFDKINNSIMFDPGERINFEYFASKAKEDSMFSDKYYNYYLENITDDQKRLGKNFIKQKALEHEQDLADQNDEGGVLAAIGGIISLWLAAPFVFLFLLVDEGEIKKNLVYLVPNQYFEMILTMIDNVDEAIGNYLRGTLTECGLVGLTFTICLFMIGIEFQLALLIGLIAGLANAIPFLGPAIGMIVGMSYALIAEEISPIIPMVTVDNMIIWVLITVGIAQGLDNAVFQPIVLGSAVSLHPLVVIIGVMGGSILLGFAGMLFAIPTIVIFKVVFVTFFEQMKAYRII